MKRTASLLVGTWHVEPFDRALLRAILGGIPRHVRRRGNDEAAAGGQLEVTPAAPEPTEVAVGCQPLALPLSSRLARRCHPPN